MGTAPTLVGMSPIKIGVVPIDVGTVPIEVGMDPFELGMDDLKPGIELAFSGMLIIELCNIKLRNITIYMLKVLIMVLYDSHAIRPNLLYVNLCCKP